MSLRLAGALLLGPVLAVQVPAQAQEDYPSRPVNVVVPQPPGGGFDFRLLGRRRALDPTDPGRRHHD